MWIKKFLFLKIQSYDVIPNENRLLTNLNMFVKFIPFNKRSKGSLWYFNKKGVKEPICPFVFHLMKYFYKLAFLNLDFSNLWSIIDNLCLFVTRGISQFSWICYYLVHESMIFKRADPSVSLRTEYTRWFYINLRKQVKHPIYHKKSTTIWWRNISNS